MNFGFNTDPAMIKARVLRVNDMIDKTEAQSRTNDERGLPVAERNIPKGIAIRIALENLFKRKR